MVIEQVRDDLKETKSPTEYAFTKDELPFGKDIIDERRNIEPVIAKVAELSLSQ